MLFHASETSYPTPKRLPSTTPNHHAATTTPVGALTPRAPGIPRTKPEAHPIANEVSRGACLAPAVGVAVEHDAELRVVEHALQVVRRLRLAAERPRRTSPSQLKSLSQVTTGVKQPDVTE